MPKVQYNRFYWGMTWDPSIWVDWGIYDGEWIDIRSDIMVQHYEMLSALYFTVIQMQ
jgi:hypothetical protein